MSFTKEMIFQYTWKLNTENHLVFLSFHEESVSAAPKKENNLSELWDYFKQHNKYKIGIPQK